MLSKAALEVERNEESRNTRMGGMENAVKGSQRHVSEELR